MTAVIGALGVLRAHGDLPRLFDLEAEATIPAVWSGMVLMGAAALAGLSFWVCEPAARRWTSLALAILFAYMSLDELLSFHERLEDLFQLDWQIIYIPVGVAAALAAAFWALAVRKTPVLRPALAWFGLGAAAWFVAQVLERFEWNGADVRVRGYVWMMVPEEILEAGGACAFLLAMLITERYGRSTRQDRDDGPPPIAQAPRTGDPTRA
jgi:hypothetical protein